VRLLLGRGGSGTLERIVDVDPAPAQHTLSRQRGRGGCWHGTTPAQHTLTRLMAWRVPLSAQAEDEVAGIGECPAASFSS
jgi:hypothetical protein